MYLVQSHAKEAIGYMLPFQKICGILQWNEGGDKYMNAKDTLETVWKGLMDYADANKVI